jgi:hypothetical protein
VALRERDVYGDFLKNIKEHTKGNIKPIISLSEDFYKTLKPDFKLKFGHIDGAHDYDSVKLDITSLQKFLVPGGILFGDDFNTAHAGRIDLKGGVERAVRECCPGFVSLGRCWHWQKK